MKLALKNVTLTVIFVQIDIELCEAIVMFLKFCVLNAKIRRMLYIAVFGLMLLKSSCSWKPNFIWLPDHGTSA